MPAILTAQPQIFAPDGVAASSPNQPGIGPFIAGDGKWDFFNNNNSFSGPSFIFERTPAGGPPWVTQDPSATDNPQILNIFYSNGCYDPRVDKFFVANHISGAGHAIFVFDCATKSWETPTAGDTDTNFSLQGFGRLANGDYIILMYDNAGGTNLYYRKYSGGSWGARTLLFTGVQRGNVRAVLDSSDRFHIFWGNDHTYPAPADLYYGQFDASALSVTVSPSAVFTFAVAGFTNQDNFSDVILDETNDKVYWLAAPFTSGAFTANHLPVLLVGTGLSAPTFTSSSPDPTETSLPDQTTQDQSVSLWIGFDGNSKNLVAVWGVAYGDFDPITGSRLQVQAWTNTLTSGSWGTPALLYDVLANPGPDFSLNTANGFHSSLFWFNVLKLASNWVFLFGYEADPPTYTDKTYIIEPLVNAKNNYVSAGGPMAARGNSAAA